MSSSIQPIVHDVPAAPAPYRWLRRIAVAVAGFLVLIVGVLMILTPGPAFIVIPIGLGILGLEFAWARRWLAQLRARSHAAVDKLSRVRKAPAQEDLRR